MTDEVQDAPIVEVLAPEATPEEVAPESVETPETETETQEAEAPKTYTEDEVKALRDAEAAKIRNKYERKMEKLRIEAETRAKIEAEQASQPKQTPAIKAEDFDNWEAYQDALLDQKLESRISKREQEAQAKQAEESQKAQIEYVESLSQNMLEKGNEKYGDMDEILEDIKDNFVKHKVGLDEPARMAILESDISHELIHHLHENPDEALRIANLSRYGQAKEIGKLEDKLSAPKKLTKTPAPAKPIDGNKTLTKKLEDMSYEEMLEHDRKRGAKYLR